MARAQDALANSGNDGEALAKAALSSTARLNVSVSFAIEFLKSDRSLYMSYGKAVTADARRPAAPDDDAMRRMIDARLFGTYGDEIRYAALGLAESGLTSYGPVTLELRSEAVAQRASLLEENAFAYFERHSLGQIGKDSKGYRANIEPLGRRSGWSTRHLLALAKLTPQLPVPPEEYPRLLLSSSADRRHDEFIEVHIYGPFDRRAVKRVILPTNRPVQADAREWGLLKRTLKTHNILWVTA